MDDVFKQPHKPVEAVFQTDEAHCGLLENVFEDVALSVSALAIDRAKTQWTVRLILDGNQREAFEERLQNLQRHYPITPPTMAPLEMQDWVSLVQQHFKPIHAGRFYLYGSHIETPPPTSSLPILMDAGAAFGTGEHETTKGCLLAMDALFRERPYRRALDMGCGSGVLAIAAAKALSIHVDAVDNDAISVRVAKANVQRNNVQPFVRTECAQGYRASIVRGEYDLIIANILARPLMRMAKNARTYLASGGTLVLSGLLTRQEHMVLWAHRLQGMVLVKRLRLGPWSVLVLRG